MIVMLFADVQIYKRQAKLSDCLDSMSKCNKLLNLEPCSDMKKKTFERYPWMFYESPSKQDKTNYTMLSSHVTSGFKVWTYAWHEYRITQNMYHFYVDNPQ